MKVQVDFHLFEMLVECIDKQAKLSQQDEDTQKRWKAVINETYRTAATAVTQFKSQTMYNDERTEVGQGPILHANGDYV